MIAFDQVPSLPITPPIFPSQHTHTIYYYYSPHSPGPPALLGEEIFPHAQPRHSPKPLEALQATQLHVPGHANLPQAEDAVEGVQRVAWPGRQQVRLLVVVVVVVVLVSCSTPQPLFWMDLSRFGVFFFLCLNHG